MTTPAVNIFNVGASAAKTAATASVVPESPEIFMARKKPVKDAGDTVEISELAQALTGKAAELFNNFDDKTRSTLESIVKSRVMTAKEMTSALHAVATQSLFGRFIDEAAPTTQQREISARNRQLEQLRKAEESETMPLYNELRRINAPDSGITDPTAKFKEINDKIQQIKAYYDPDDGQSNSEEAVSLTQSYFQINVDRFKQMDLGEDDYRGAGILSEESLRDKDRLFDLIDKIGVDKMKFGFAVESYAANVEMAGIGKKVMPTWEAWRAQQREA